MAVFNLTYAGQPGPVTFNAVTGVVLNGSIGASRIKPGGSPPLTGTEEIRANRTRPRLRVPMTIAAPATPLFRRVFNISREFCVAVIVMGALTPHPPQSAA